MIRAAGARSKPSITATQMLASMVTRAARPGPR
jgi:pyruvate kinase